MPREFELERDCYGTGEKLFRKKRITINPGVTVLVGCNGIGKTTLLGQIESGLKKAGAPCVHYDNLGDGGSTAVSAAAYRGDFESVAAAMASSEGENIVLNMGSLAGRLGGFMEKGKGGMPSDVLADAFAKAIWGKQEEGDRPKERWILLDAVDSGLSVDNIEDLKRGLFDTVLEYNYGNDVYIVVSANEYEMANGEQCFDVYHGKYRTFKSYTAYRNFILRSRTWKEERAERARKLREKKGEKDD